MMRPLNWLSRRDSSLVTVVMSTVKEPLVTFTPSMVIDPLTPVRPTASVLCPT
ncbi:MAG: hypothetical protein M3P34_07125 [Actinomycetota bacterium]|nr:hypothetical protein [Actinomycetota bacterium]